MADTVTCVNTYGPESGPHTGPAEWAAQLYVPATGRDSATRIEPLCRGHVEYEQRWRDAIGAISRVRIEPAQDGRPAETERSTHG